MPGEFEVAGIDIGIVIAYLVLSRVFCIWMTRGKAKDTGGFFLGGRSFVWPLIGFSLFATNMSGSSFVGLAGAGYNSGVSVYSYEWMTSIILVIFVLFILPFYLRSKVFTMPEFLERRFDRRMRYFFAGFLLFLNIFVDCAAALYAGALVVQQLFPDTPLWICVAGLAGLSMVLSITGGLGAVVLSDTIQAVVLYIGGAMIFVAAYYAIPSWDAVREATGPDALSIVQPIGDEALPWPGLFSGVLIIGIYFWITNQMIVQRTLGAKSLDHGRWGAIFAAFLKIPVLFIMILPGTMAVVLYPDLETPDLAFPTLAFDLMPIGLRGVILAALIAAITSTVDSILNSASTMMTMDLVRPSRPNMSDRNLVRIGRVTTGLVTLIACIWAPQIQNFPSLWQYLQSVLSYLAPPVVAVFLLGIFWPRANANAAFYTVATMVPLGLIAFIMNEVAGIVQIQFLYASGISFVTSLILITTISLAGERPDKEVVEELTWDTDVWRQESEHLATVPAWQNYRYLSIVLLIVTAIVVGLFW